MDLEEFREHYLVTARNIDLEVTDKEIEKIFVGLVVFSAKKLINHSEEE